MRAPGARPRYSKKLLGILGVDLGLFLLATACYIGARSHTPVWPRPFHFPSGLMTVSMAMFAVAASFVMHVAARYRKPADRVMRQRMMALALVGWATFLFLLAMEWARLYLVEHVTLRANPWTVPALGLSYYGLTAFVAAHILVGALWLIAAFQTPEKWDLGNLTLFVDFSNALWIVIAFSVILSSADLNGF